MSAFFRSAFVAYAKFFYLFLLVVLICAPLGGYAGRVALPASTSSGPGFDSLHELTSEIIRRFPASEYFYVGVGRSPTAITCLMEQQGIATKTVPLSGLRIAGTARTSDEWAYHLQAHLESFLPSAEELQGKKILLLDFSHSGNSILAADGLVRAYLKSSGRGGTVETLAMTLKGQTITEEGKNVPLAKIFDAKNIHLLELQSSSPIYKDMSGSKFDTFAKFGEFDVARPLRAWSEPIAQKNSYRRLSEAVAESMKAKALKSSSNLFGSELGCQGRFSRLFHWGTRVFRSAAHGAAN